MNSTAVYSCTITACLLYQFGITAAAYQRSAVTRTPQPASGFRLCLIRIYPLIKLLNPHTYLGGIITVINQAVGYPWRLGIALRLADGDRCVIRVLDVTICASGETAFAPLPISNTNPKFSPLHSASIIPELQLRRLMKFPVQRS